MKEYSIGTKCVQAGYAAGNGEPRQIPIIQSTTFKYDTSEASNVERFFDMLPENAYVETAYSIGEKTTAVLEKHNVREILQADDSSYEALVDKISYKDAFKD